MKDSDELSRQQDAALALRQGRAGDLRHLMARFDRDVLTPEEKTFILDVLERANTPAAKEQQRKLERALVRLHVEGLIRENWPPDAAVAEVMRRRQLSRATVFRALALPEWLPPPLQRLVIQLRDLMRRRR